MISKKIRQKFSEKFGYDENIRMFFFARESKFNR